MFSLCESTLQMGKKGVETGQSELGKRLQLSLRAVGAPVDTLYRKFAAAMGSLCPIACVFLLPSSRSLVVVSSDLWPNRARANKLQTHIPTEDVVDGESPRRPRKVKRGEGP